MHKHEHEHSYTHSHEHEHDHEHEHCHEGCCGHEHGGPHHHYGHGNEHEHHHEECCGHEHRQHECNDECCSGHHEHGASCGCDSCSAGGFRLTRVEGATAAAVRFTMSGSVAVAEVEITRRIKAMAADISEAGGLVGHIKGAITGEAEVSTFSCTGGAVAIGRRSEPPTCKVDLVAILLGLTDEAIETAVRKRFPEIE